MAELLDNAVIHAEVEAPTVAVSVRTDEEWVVIEVCDDCPSIPAEEFGVLTGDLPMDEVTHTTGLGSGWSSGVSISRADGSRSTRPPTGTASRCRCRPSDPTFK
ncbi:ATP-binding protein [Halomicroarcula sp. GCM10025709]|uniref:ATP-binding protein n=1 Tax=Halomicroarcula sp. GCM10025709 TaxID=3252669 RepID=UPI0036183899